MSLDGLKDVIAEFNKLVPELKEKFLEYAKEEMDNTRENEQMNEIIEFLREKTSLSAEEPDEKLWYPQFGVFKGNNKNDTISVDSFLYTESDVDDLVEEGKLSISFCLDCGSKNTAPYNFISHSWSVEEMKCAFGFLPDLKGKQILDLGSRLGPVLYYAYLNSKASRIIGVEFNAYFTDLQTEVVEKFNMSDRVTVIHGDMFEQEKYFDGSDVIFMHNCFEMFGDIEKNKESWNKLHALIKRKGCLLVTSPSLEKSVKSLKLSHIDIKTWVAKLNENEDLDIHIYMVK